MELVKPDIKYRDSFIEGLLEYQAEGGFLTVDAKERKDNFEAYIERLQREFTEGIGKNNEIHMQHFWLINNDKYIGTSLLRYELDNDLVNIGGNISYEIRPTERRKGYGKKILKLTLDEARRAGLKKVLLTCDKDNIASRKIIEANEGVEDASFFREGMRIEKLRYWIQL